MRYAIVSDIHANWQAWNAVLLDIRSSDIDRLICLGDSVGYGPQPARVLESVHEHVHHVVLGNHDAAVCGKLDEALFNDNAAEIVRWTRDQLNPSAMSFLESLPLTLRGDLFRCAHGDLASPAQFNYIIEPEEAVPSWQATEEQLLFVGHSHDPAIFLLGQSGTPHRVPPQDFSLESGKRYIVNVGSVGQPRDGDARASYCIIDTDTQSIFWRRIPFDLDAYRSDLAVAGVSARASYFLSIDPRQASRPIRETLSFAPPARIEDGAIDVVEEAQLADLQREVRQWKRLAAIVIVMALLVLGGAGILVQRHLSRALEISDPETEGLVIQSSVADHEANLLALPTAPIATPASIPGWRVQLGHHRKQKVGWVTTPEPQFVVVSGTVRDPLRIESPLIQVTKGERYRISGLIRATGKFQGSLQLDVTLWKYSEAGLIRIDHFAGDLADSARKDGWYFATETFSIPADGSLMRVGVDGKFAGHAEIRDLKLFRVK